MQGGVSVYCFRLVRRTLLSLQSPRLSQQTLRVDWRTCGQAWPPSLFCSHGTDSRPDIFPENMFFQLTFSGFNFWLNPLLWISTCFFFFLHWLVLFHGIGPTLQEMPGVFGIRWNHLWLLIFFCIHVGEAQADWFVVLLLCSVLHFLSVHEPDQTVSYICLC